MYNDEELQNILYENGYKPSDKNVYVLKEGLESGKYTLEEGKIVDAITKIGKKIGSKVKSTAEWQGKKKLFSESCEFTDEDLCTVLEYCDEEVSEENINTLKEALSLALDENRASDRYMDNLRNSENGKDHEHFKDLIHDDDKQSVAMKYYAYNDGQSAKKEYNDAKNSENIENKVEHLKNHYGYRSWGKQDANLSKENEDKEKDDNVLKNQENKNNYFKAQNASYEFTDEDLVTVLEYCDEEASEENVSALKEALTLTENPLIRVGRSHTNPRPEPADMNFKKLVPHPDHDGTFTTKDSTGNDSNKFIYRDSAITDHGYKFNSKDYDDKKVAKQMKKAQEKADKVQEVQNKKVVAYDAEQSKREKEYNDNNFIKKDDSNDKK